MSIVGVICHLLYTLLYCRAVSVLQMISTVHIIVLQGCIFTADDKYCTPYCTAGPVSVLQMTRNVHLIVLQGCICTADDKYVTPYCTAGLYLYCR